MGADVGRLPAVIRTQNVLSFLKLTLYDRITLVQFGKRVFLKLSILTTVNITKWNHIKYVLYYLRIKIYLIFSVVPNEANLIRTLQQGILLYNTSPTLTHTYTEPKAK